MCCNVGDIITIRVKFVLMSTFLIGVIGGIL